MTHVPNKRQDMLIPTPGRNHLYVDALPAGWVRVVCPLGGDWHTTRPAGAAWSAGEAHRLQHVKGMGPLCEGVTVP